MIVSPCRCLLWYGSSSSKSVIRLWLGLKVLMPGMRSPCPNGVVLAWSLGASVGSCQLSESHQRSMTWVLRKPTTRQGNWSEGWELSASRRSCGLNFLKEGVWDAICVKDEASDEAVSSSAISIRWVGTPLLTSRSIGKYKPSTTARSYVRQATFRQGFQLKWWDVWNHNVQAQLQQEFAAWLPQVQGIGQPSPVWWWPSRIVLLKGEKDCFPCTNTRSIALQENVKSS